MEQEMKFEQQMKKLQEIVEKLEKGDVDLDESIHLYEEGLKLSKGIRGQLDGFEKKIGELIAEHDLLSEDGMLIIESSSGTEVELSGLSRIREKTYKTTRFTFFERLENQ